MSKTEILTMMRQLAHVFDIVRLVDASITTQIHLDEDGSMTAEPYQCYAVWKKTKRCENCVSARAIACRSTRSKFEFVDESIYYVIAKYVEVDGTPYTLEMVSKIDEETLMGAYGKSEFIEAISKHNEKMYLDSLTGVYNRRYYDDQIQYLLCKGAMAILDVDDFKAINDTYGHLAGDKALQAVAWVLRHSVRESDAVVRYGGDEFLIIFLDFPEELFPAKLEKIRAAIAHISLEELQGTQITASIGGICWKGTVGEALPLADKMLYRAKKQKNIVKI